MPRGPASTGSCPLAVCLPVDREDLVSLVRWASEHRVPLVPRGAGSAMGGGNVGEGVVVDLTASPSPTRHPPRRAARRDQRQRHAGRAQHRGRSAPASGCRPIPPAAGCATLGGMVSTNASGARTVRYGSVRRWVVGARAGDGRRRGAGAPARRGGRRGRDAQRFVASRPRWPRPSPRRRGSIAARFPRTRKNSSGYALDAWLGLAATCSTSSSAPKGTLGFVTASTGGSIRRRRTAPALRVELRSLDDLAEAWSPRCSRCEPSAVELLDRTFLELVAAPRWAKVSPLPKPSCWWRSSATTRRAAREAVANAAAAAVRPWAAAVDTALTAAAADRLWALRHAASPILAACRRPPLAAGDRGRLRAPSSGWASTSAPCAEAAAARGIAVVIFGHAGDGHVHVNLLPEVGRAGWEQSGGGAARGGDRRRSSGWAARRRASTATAGSAPDCSQRVYGDEVVGLFARVKRAFDPLGILNPGVILPSRRAGRRSRRLKVGAHAVAAPGRHRARPARIEQGGGYAQQPARAGRRHSASPLTHDAMDILREPRVTLIARPQFLEPAHLPVAVEGRVHRRRAHRRVRRPALLHEPAQSGGPDHGRVSPATS